MVVFADVRMNPLSMDEPDPFQTKYKKGVGRIAELPFCDSQLDLLFGLGVKTVLTHTGKEGLCRCHPRDILL